MNTQTLHITSIEAVPKVDIKNVICVRCNLVHLLDADGHCEFCRRHMASPPKTTWDLVAALLGDWLRATGNRLRHPFARHLSPVTVHTDLPPSVVSD